VRDYVSEMLIFQGQSGLKAKIFALASKPWPWSWP